MLVSVGYFWGQHGRGGGQFLFKCPWHILLVLVPHSGRQIQPLHSVLGAVGRVCMLGFDWWAGLWAGFGVGGPVWEVYYL